MACQAPGKCWVKARGWSSLLLPSTEAGCVCGRLHRLHGFCRRLGRVRPPFPPWQDCTWRGLREERAAQWGGCVGGLGTRRPLLPGWCGERGLGAGPRGTKDFPLQLLSQIILEAGQRVPRGPLPSIYAGALFSSLPAPTPAPNFTSPPWSPRWPGPSLVPPGGRDEAWERQWGLQAAVWFP